MRHRMMTLVAALVLVLLTACGEDGGNPAGSTDETPVTGSQGDATGPGHANRGVVEGVVRTASGAALPGVLVVPVSLDHPAIAIPELAVVTDARGSYRWDLPGGRYEVRAVQAGAVVGTVEVEVARGRTAGGDISLH